MNKLGMNFVAIPCWWDGEIARYSLSLLVSHYIFFSFDDFNIDINAQCSLSSTIDFHCPELVPSAAVDPIPLNPPFQFFKGMFLLTLLLFCLL